MKKIIAILLALIAMTGYSQTDVLSAAQKLMEEAIETM